MFGLGTSILLGISLAAPIGPLSIEVIKRGLRRGFIAAFSVCVGGAAGDLFYLLLTFFGLAPFMSLPVVRTSIMILGSIVLIYFGVQNILDGFKKKLFIDSEEASGTNAFILGFSLAVINPMSVVWWLGVFGAVMGSLPPESLTISALIGHLGIILGVLIWSLFLSTVLHFGKSYITDSRMKLVCVLAGIFFITFGLNFFYQAITLLL
ncbi:MAG: threonine/homoserine/homoserine lactone efflux protein [Chlamydiales bacterium]|jgi:threonine/homoserine/homoserine lactone efflux protein